MKLLKKIVIVLLIIIAIPLIVALFVSKDFKGEGTVVINKPKQEVFDYIKYVENQENFGVWQLSDPDMKITYEGTDGTEGFVSKWESEKVGSGSQTITKIVENDSVIVSLYFGFGEPAKGYFILREISPNETSVTWGVSGKSPYPWNFMGLFMDMNKDFEQGTQTLKEILEAQESSVDDKKFVLEYYSKTLHALRTSVSGLNKEQMHFKPSEESWSISQCLEHIILTENMIFGMIKEYMEKPANPERREEIKFSDRDIIAMVTDRSEKHKAPEMLIAKGKYDNPETAIRDLRVQREEIFLFINNTPTKDFRNRVNDSPAGPTDAYQSLLFLAGHTARHTLQIEEIKAADNFPK